ncbi:hypothetical protein QTP88_010618 [Uroleucon formosanum]
MVHDAWKEIESKLSFKTDVTELKKKKDSLMATYRKLSKKIKASKGTGSGADEVFKPDWFAYNAMIFLGDIYEVKKTISTEFGSKNGKIYRGVNSAAISTSTLWWEGPEWLVAVKDNWPSYETTVDELPEVRKVKLVLTSIRDFVNPILEKFSRWLPLIHTTGWMLRFINNAKLQGVCV